MWWIYSKSGPATASWDWTQTFINGKGNARDWHAAVMTLWYEADFPKHSLRKCKFIRFHKPSARFESTCFGSYFTWLHTLVLIWRDPIPGHFSVEGGRLKSLGLIPVWERLHDKNSRAIRTPGFNANLFVGLLAKSKLAQEKVTWQWSVCRICQREEYNNLPRTTRTIASLRRPLESLLYFVIVIETRRILTVRGSRTSRIG